VKQLLTIAVLLVYSLASSGYTLNVHYCCGKIDSINFTAATAASCQHGMEMKDGPCCADRSVHFDVDDTMPAGPVTAPLPGVCILPALLLPAALVPQVGETACQPFFTDSSPPIQAPLTVLHCSFRI
jgi:hypothetical protein